MTSILSADSFSAMVLSCFLPCVPCLFLVLSRLPFHPSALPSFPFHPSVLALACATHRNQKKSSFLHGVTLAPVSVLTALAFVPSCACLVLSCLVTVFVIVFSCLALPMIPTLCCNTQGNSKKQPAMQSCVHTCQVSTLLL